MNTDQPQPFEPLQHWEPPSGPPVVSPTLEAMKASLTSAQALAGELSTSRQALERAVDALLNAGYHAVELWDAGEECEGAMEALRDALSGVDIARARAGQPRG